MLNFGVQWIPSLTALALLNAACWAAAPTFRKDVAPLMFKHCSGCHRPGQSAPFNLLTYDDAAKHAKDMASVTRSRYMPPWLPDPNVTHFEGERVLRGAEIQVFSDWAAAGAPEGTGELPAMPKWPEGWQLGAPDLVLEMPEFTVPAEGRDVYRAFVAQIPVTSTQYVAALEFDPGNRRVAHHAFFRIDRTRNSRDRDAQESGPGFGGMDAPATAQSPDGHFLSWQPGKRWSTNPKGLSWRLHPKSDLVLQMHMQPSGKEEKIQSKVAFYFTADAPTRFPLKLGLDSYAIDIPAGETNYVVSDSFQTPVDIDVMGVLPHAHYLGKTLEGFVVLPNGQTNWLIHIPDWDFNWQGDYRFVTPVFAPKGSTLAMRYRYDNSQNNPRNPNNPPKRVTYGAQTTDEMAELWLQVLPRNPADMAALRKQSDRKLLAEALDYADYRLRLNPNDARAMAHKGQALMAQGRGQEALQFFAQAAEADPKFDEPHYFIGVILRGRNQSAAAIESLQKAVAANPNNSKAHGNLGLIHFEEGRIKEAEESLLRAAEIDHLDAIARDTLGVIYLRQGKLAEAEKHLREAAALDPSDTQTQAHLKILESALKRK